MDQKGKQIPSTWRAYERGRTASVDSLGSIAEGEAQNNSYGSPTSPRTTRLYHGSETQDGGSYLRERRPSMLGSIRQMGGVNNIDNFARSFQRAAGFRTITPVRRSSISFTDGGEEEGREGMDTQSRSLPNKSLLRQQFEAAQRENTEAAVVDGHTESIEPELTETSPLLPVRSPQAASVFSRSQLRPEAGAELGTSFGSISTRLTSTARRRASVLIQQQIEASTRAREAQESGEEPKDDAVEHAVEVETREDGEVIERLVGESTVPMTIFTSINVLIGVGILALPLAIRYSGWVIGMIALLMVALVTNYTARLLAKCLDTNSGSTTYGDLAFLAFGDVGRTIVEILFVLELTGANVALLILFGDSMHSLTPTLSTTFWKVVLAVGLLPLNFVPFKTLSVTSVLGIVSTLVILGLVLVDGFVKPQKPGSLRQVMDTHAFPENWRTVPLSIGLFIAPWGGHSVFPAVYKDMRHPQKYGRAVRWTYIFTYGLDLTMGVFGYLMFGDIVRDEITSNILSNRAYPKALSILIVFLIAIIPITKVPLSNRPIMDTLNKKFLIDLRQMDVKARQYSEKSWKHRSGRAAIGIACNISQLGISVLLPDFDSIMATLGSSFCLSICVILPIAFYLQIFSSDSKEISRVERLFDWIVVVLAVLIAITGTVTAILPKEKLGIKACQGIACLG